MMITAVVIMISGPLLLLIIKKNLYNILYLYPVLRWNTHKQSRNVTAEERLDISQKWLADIHLPQPGSPNTVILQAIVFKYLIQLYV